MMPLDPSLTAFRATSRGAALTLVCCLLPIVGWWVFMPAALAISLGAGALALMEHQSRVVEAVA